MVDTRPEAEAVLRDVILRRTPSERVMVVVELSEQMREVALDALRLKYPAESLLDLIERLTGEPMRPGVRSGPHRAL